MGSHAKAHLAQTECLLHVVRCIAAYRQVGLVHKHTEASLLQAGLDWQRHALLAVRAPVADKDVVALAGIWTVGWWHSHAKRMADTASSC